MADSARLLRRGAPLLRSPPAAGPEGCHAHASMIRPAGTLRVVRRSPREVLWRLRPVPAGPPTWAADLDGIAIRWPAEYEWAPAAQWVNDLATGMEGHVPLASADIPQPPKLVVFEADVDGRRHEVAIDYGDVNALDPAVADRYPLVLKMQYATAGYGRPNVVPAGYVPSRSWYYRALGPARRIREGGRRDYELFGRFSLERAVAIRRKAVRHLRAQDRFAFEGDLTLASFPAFLSDAARSRVCLDLPGNGDLCHRLVEYLGLGCCVVRPQPKAVLHIPLVDDEHVVCFKRDLSDLVEVRERLLADPARQERIGAAARALFDGHLHRDQLAGHWLQVLAQRLR